MTNVSMGRYQGRGLDYGDEVAALDYEIIHQVKLAK
jgi:hypothetical protein